MNLDTVKTSSTSDLVFYENLTPSKGILLEPVLNMKQTSHFMLPLGQYLEDFRLTVAYASKVLYLRHCPHAHNYENNVTIKLEMEAQK